MAVASRTKQDVVAEFRCSSIIEAARGVFAKKGFARATIEEVAEAAGVAKGTVYLYFPSKEAIYLAALRQGIEAVHAQTRERMDQAQTTEGKIRAFLETRVRLVDENRDFFRIYYSELGNIFSLPNKLYRELNQLYRKQATVLAEVIREGQTRGDIRKMPPEETARAIYELTRGVIAQRLRDGSQLSGRDELLFLLDFIWKGIEKR